MCWFFVLFSVLGIACLVGECTLYMIDTVKMRGKDRVPQKGFTDFLKVCLKDEASALHEKSFSPLK